MKSSKPVESTTQAALPTAPIPGANGVVGAAGDLGDKTCQYAGGGWNFTGTLTNSQKSAQAYNVRIAIRDTKTSSVVNAVDIAKTLAPAKSAKLDQKAIVKTPSDAGLDCVVSVTRKPA